MFLIFNLISYSDSETLPTWLSIVGGLLFLAFSALAFWGYMRSMNNRRPKHITEGLPFFKRAFAEGKPILWFCLGVIAIMSSLSFFLMI